MLTEVQHEEQVNLAREEIVKLARQRGPGIKLPTVVEMCRQLQVTRTQLEQAMQKLEKGGLLYRRRGSGIYASDRIRQKTIGVVFGGDIYSPWYSPFWSLMLQAVRTQASERNIQPRKYFDVDDGHLQLLEDLDDRRLDGLLLLAPRHEYDEAAELSAYGVPLVVLGNRAPTDWSVIFDSHHYFELAAAELAATGARRIGFVATPDQTPAFAAALRQAGLTDVQIDDWSYETWAGIVPHAETHENCAYQLTQRMIAEHADTPLPDALVSMDDTATRGAINALLAAGLHPGRDMRIVTTENKGSPVLDPWAEDLARIVYDPQPWAEAALAMLDTLMAGGTPPQNPVLIAPQLEPGLQNH